MSDDRPQRFVYRIDRDDALVEVNHAWLEFARANWRPDFSPEEVLGRRLWSSISDLPTRHIHQLLVKRARTPGQAPGQPLPFRCDSPDKRRFMELTLAPLADGGVEFSSRILREEPRPAVPLLQPDRPRSRRMLAMCSWCKKIRVPEWTLAEPWPARSGDWREVEDLGSMLAGLHWEYLPEVTHSICPACQQEVMRDLGGGAGPGLSGAL